MPDPAKDNTYSPRLAPVASLFLAAVAVLTLALAGCTGQQKTAEGDAPYGAPASGASPAAATAPPASAPNTPPGPAAGGAPVVAGGPGGMMPMAGSDPMAPLSPTPEMDKAIADAEKSGDKKAIGNAYAERGYFRMTDDNAGQKVKYKAALEDYRKSLAADPTNAKAKDNKELIEGIYHQMGRPVPGEEGEKAGGKTAPPGPKVKK